MHICAQDLEKGQQNQVHSPADKRGIGQTLPDDPRGPDEKKDKRNIGKEVSALQTVHITKSFFRKPEKHGEKNQKCSCRNQEENPCPSSDRLQNPGFLMFLFINIRSSILVFLLRQIISPESVVLFQFFTSFFKKSQKSKKQEGVHKYPALAEIFADKFSQHPVPALAQGIDHYSDKPGWRMNEIDN